jgi:hypothetical protein
VLSSGAPQHIELKNTSLKMRPFALELSYPASAYDEGLHKDIILTEPHKKNDPMPHTPWNSREYPLEKTTLCFGTDVEMTEWRRALLQSQVHGRDRKGRRGALAKDADRDGDDDYAAVEQSGQWFSDNADMISVNEHSFDHGYGDSSVHDSSHDEHL